MPHDVEHAFGERHGRPVAVALPSGRTIRFSGRADRVDVSDGRVRVVDYKTGRGKQYLDTAGGGAAERFDQGNDRIAVLDHPPDGRFG